MINKENWKNLEFFVPITESLNENGDFLIKGVAINETTTLNNVKYVAEELMAAAQTFRNVPILLDHKNEVKNIVGRTTENVNWNPSLKRIEFEGKIMDKEIQEMIKDGRVGSVSIGAKINNLVEEEDGSMKAIGIHGLELSIVAIPADTQANLAHALEKSFILKEKLECNDEKQIKKEDIDMVEEPKEEEKTKEVEEVKEEPKEETPVEEPAEEVKEEPVAEATEKVSEMSEMRKQLNEVKEMLIAKKVKEDAEATEEPQEDKTKGEIVKPEEPEEDSDETVVERCDTGKLALYRDYSKESSTLKRLGR